MQQEEEKAESELIAGQRRDMGLISKLFYDLFMKNIFLQDLGKYFVVVYAE